MFDLHSVARNSEGFEDFFLVGKHQPKSLFHGRAVYSVRYPKKVEHSEEVWDGFYEYTAYAVKVAGSYYPQLLLSRRVIAQTVCSWTGDDMEECVFSKYSLPKDKLEIQKFDCPNSEEKFAMRAEYEDFLKKLSIELFKNETGFYLTAEDIQQMKG